MKRKTGRLKRIREMFDPIRGSHFDGSISTDYDPDDNNTELGDEKNKLSFSGRSNGFLSESRTNCAKSGRKPPLDHYENS